MDIKEKHTFDLSDKKIFSFSDLPLDAKYQYKVLEKKHIEQVVDVFTKAFCRSEPMTHYLHMDEEKYRVFAQAVTLKAYEDGLSIVALDGETVIACALTEDLADPGAIPDFDPKFEYILSLLEQLGEDFFADKKFNKGVIAHLFITAVHEDYRHQGLSRQVNFLATELAAQKNYDFVYCEFTHFFNEKGTILYLTTPKKLIGSRTYKDFIYKGIKPFAHLKGGANSYLWAVHKKAKLTYKTDSQKVTEEFV